MFTGIVERIGLITGLTSTAGGYCMRLEVGDIAAESVLGASICVSGVCLTITKILGTELEFDMIAETMRSSTLATKSVGDSVNIERSLAANGRLDGHFVQGHVDAIATVTRVLKTPEEHRIWLRPEADLSKLIIPKGSVAIDGVSLTIASVEGKIFSVAIIPTTWRETTLADCETSSVVNIETDIIARTIAHQLHGLTGSSGLTEEKLRQAGFA